MHTYGIVQVCEEIANFFAAGPTPAEILDFHLSDETIAWLRELHYKNSAGTLTTDEADELDQMVSLDRLLTLMRSKIQAERR